jgi:hypothetical protein
MKKTYATPAIITRADVMLGTLSNKAGGSEDGAGRGPTSGRIGFNL